MKGSSDPIWTRLRTLVFVLPLHGCLSYSAFEGVPHKPIYYGAITAGEGGLAALGGYSLSHPSNPSPDSSSPSFVVGTMEIWASFVAIDLIFFGLTKAID